MFSVCSAIVTLSVSFFVGLPSWITVGFLSVFTLGITILVIKLVR